MRQKGSEIRTNPVSRHDTKDVDNQLNGKLDRLVEEIQSRIKVDIPLYHGLRPCSVPSATQLHQSV
jgi:hypothetical protein